MVKLGGSHIWVQKKWCDKNLFGHCLTLSRLGGQWCTRDSGGGEGRTRSRLSVGGVNNSFELQSTITCPSIDTGRGLAGIGSALIADVGGVEPEREKEKEGYLLAEEQAEVSRLKKKKTYGWKKES